MTEEQEREAFEALILNTEKRKPLLWSEVFATSIKGDTMPAHLAGKYLIDSDQKAWSAWQARASLPSNPEHDTYGAPPVGALTGGGKDVDE